MRYNKLHLLSAACVATMLFLLARDFLTPMHLPDNGIYVSIFGILAAALELVRLELRDLRAAIERK